MLPSPAVPDIEQSIEERQIALSSEHRIPVVGAAASNVGNQLPVGGAAFALASSATSMHSAPENPMDAASGNRNCACIQPGGRMRMQGRLSHNESIKGPHADVRLVGEEAVHPLFQEPPDSARSL